MHKYIYLIVFPAIGVTVELTHLYEYGHQLKRRKLNKRHTSFLSFDQKFLFKNQIRKFYFSFVRFVSYERGFRMNSPLWW